MRKFNLLLSFAIMCMFSFQLHAQVLFEETFDYDTDSIALAGDGSGDLGTMNAVTGWYNFDYRPDYFYITPDSLIYSGYALSGQGKALWMNRNNGHEIQKPFSESITGGTFYFSFMVNPEKGYSKGSVIIRLLNSSDAVQAEIRAKRDDEKTGILFSLDTTYSDIICTYDETHLLVFKYTFAGVDESVSDSIALFINPSLAAEPTTADLKIANDNSSEISAIRLRCRSDAMEGNFDGICVSKTWDDLVQETESDDVSLASVSSDMSTVSYEDISFTLKDGTDDIYLAHDSIAYGDDDVTITATTTALTASISLPQIVNPAAGESDTAEFVVTAVDGSTTKTYKVVVARSEYQCKAGLLTGGGQNMRPEGWETVGYNYAASSKGNGGLYPGDYIMRLSDKDDKEAGSLTTPMFSQVGTLAFSGKFSESDSTESLIVLSSTNAGISWDTVTTYIAGEDGCAIPCYSGESSGDALGRDTLSINMTDVMIRFQYHQPGVEDLDDDQRTAIDDIAIKATDYVDIPTGLETVKTSETSFKVYPNPASTYIQIDGDVNSVSIYSLTGRLVKTVTNEKTINVQSLKSGIYLVKTDNDIQQLIIK